MAMDSRGKKLARDLVLKRLAELRRDEKWLVLTAAVDPGTIRSLLSASTFPQTPTRRKVERALGVQEGALERAALGLEFSASPDQDPVETAIEGSSLTRGNKKRLIGTYYDMLDSQPEAGESA